jgi:hypothetical protein
VTMTIWRGFEIGEIQFLRKVDLSRLRVDHRTEKAWEGDCWSNSDTSASDGLSGAMNLESVILPANMWRVPKFFCNNCPRLSHVGMSYCTELLAVEYAAFGGCRSLREFSFPSTLRRLDYSFHGASIITIDLSGTAVEHVNISEMMLLERIVLPRRCMLSVHGGVPRLRTVTFGAYSLLYAWSPRMLRFESMERRKRDASLPVQSSGRQSYAFAEVACVLGRDSFPFPP